jgi:excisionase family DNA binding protein
MLDEGDGRRRLLTIGQASRMLNIHPNTLRRWSDLGLIRAYRVGPRGDRRFKQNDVEAMLAKRAAARPA